MNEPTAKILAINSIRQAGELAEICTREQAAEVYRHLIREAKRLAEKHKLRVEVVK